MNGMNSNEARDGHALLHERIEAPLKAEIERLKNTEKFLRSERPMARRLTELEDALKSCASAVSLYHVRKIVAEALGDE